MLVVVRENTTVSYSGKEYKEKEEVDITGDLLNALLQAGAVYEKEVKAKKSKKLDV